MYKPWEVFAMQGCGGGGEDCGNKTLKIFLFKKQKCSCFFLHDKDEILQSSLFYVINRKQIYFSSIVFL